ncbi:MAG: hypothetical protein ACRD2J_03360 [Thermoanaerobaculia bacterium]
MKLRSIKGPAGRSKVSLAEATRAAKVVRRESATGRFVVVPSGPAVARDRKSAKHLAKKR